MVKPAPFANGIGETAFRSIRRYEFKVHAVSRKGEKLHKSGLHGIVNDWRAHGITIARHVDIGNRLNRLNGIPNVMKSKA